MFTRDWDKFHYVLTWSASCTNVIATVLKEIAKLVTEAIGWKTAGTIIAFIIFSNGNWIYVDSITICWCRFCGWNSSCNYKETLPWKRCRTVLFVCMYIHKPKISKPYKLSFHDVSTIVTWGERKWGQYLIVSPGQISSKSAQQSPNSKQIGSQKQVASSVTPLQNPSSQHVS